MKADFTSVQSKQLQYSEDYKVQSAAVSAVSGVWALSPPGYLKRQMLQPSQAAPGLLLLLLSVFFLLFSSTCNCNLPKAK